MSIEFNGKSSAGGLPAIARNAWSPVDQGATNPSRAIDLGGKAVKRLVGAAIGVSYGAMLAHVPSHMPNAAHFMSLPSAQRSFAELKQLIKATHAHLGQQLAGRMASLAQLDAHPRGPDTAHRRAIADLAVRKAQNQLNAFLQAKEVHCDRFLSGIGREARIALDRAKFEKSGASEPNHSERAYNFSMSAMRQAIALAKAPPIPPNDSTARGFAAVQEFQRDHKTSQTGQVSDWNGDMNLNKLSPAHLVMLGKLGQKLKATETATGKMPDRSGLAAVMRSQAQLAVQDVARAIQANNLSGGPDRAAPPSA